MPAPHRNVSPWRRGRPTFTPTSRPGCRPSRWPASGTLPPLPRRNTWFDPLSSRSRRSPGALAPRGAERSGNPWHVHEYRAEEFAGLLFAHFSDVELYGLFHARKLRLHDWMLRAGWDAVHPRVGLTGPFYSRFTPAISERDFSLRAGVPAQLQRALDFVAVCRM